MNTLLGSTEPQVGELMQVGVRHDGCFQGQISLSQTSSLKEALPARRPGGPAKLL